MDKPIITKKTRFYLWVGLAYFTLGFLTDLGNDTQTLPKWAINEIWSASYIVALNYIFFEYILPALRWKSPFTSFLLLLGQLFLCAPGFFAWRGLGIALHLYTSFTTDPGKRIIADKFGESIFSLFFFGIIKHIYDHLQLKRTAQRLQIEKQAAELNYLKSQTNPHFLFNTLNNIYALSLDKSDLTPEAILRLSKILRFMLYETSGDYIAVEQELKIMSDYIELEKLRYDDTLHVNFNYDIEDQKQALPPLLLIPLVENAFKHGVSETRNTPFVDIHLSIKQRRLTFLVKNSTEETDPNPIVKENIGLSNLRRQLQLLYNEYDLTVLQDLRVFTATLKINLASHV